MQQVKRLFRGSTPLLISMPHVGTYLPPDLRRRMTPEGLRVADTDWHIDKLYWFAQEMGAGIIMPTHSRYVIDLNRPQDDAALYAGQVKTGLCPLESFDGDALYQEGEEPDEIEKINRTAAYWLPYHEALEAELELIKQEFGYAILYDAHSIRAHVPRLFDGRLPDLNVGTAKGTSCAPAMGEAVMNAIDGYSKVLNGRFVGGHITRHYGQPDQHIHAIQMELAQVNYMDEKTFAYDEAKAAQLQKTLKDVIAALLAWGQGAYPS